MVFVVCFVIIVILHSVKAVICLFMQKTFTPEISLPKVQEFFFSWWSHAPSITYMYSPWLCTSQLVCVWCKWQDRLSKKKIRSAGFYISRIFNTQPLSRRGLLEGFYTCTKLSRFFFNFTTKRWYTWILHCKNPWLWCECSIYHIHQCKLFQHTSSDIW